MHTEKISAIINCYNEEKNLPKLIESLKDMDEIIVIDHESNDRTAKIARKLGCKVIHRPWPFVRAIEKDITDFKMRFGFDPSYKVGDTIIHGGDERNICSSFAKNDWIFYIDADEVVRWDFKYIQEIMRNNDMISCDFVHTRTPEGRADIVFDTTKLYRKSKCWWIGRLHEYVTGYNIRHIKAVKMRVDHYQEIKKERAMYLPLLEYSALRDATSRSQHYLGREYYLYGMYDKARTMLQISLREAFNVTEIISSYIHLAKCSYMLGNLQEANGYCFEAMKVDPTVKSIYQTMAEISGPEKAKTWKRFAEVL